MSVLETFYILFKSDAGKAAEDLREMETAAGEIEDALNKVDTSLHDAAAEANRAATEAARLAQEYSDAKDAAARLAIEAKQAKLEGTANAAELAQKAQRANLEAEKLSVELNSANKEAKKAAEEVKSIEDGLKEAADEAKKTTNETKKISNEVKKADEHVKRLSASFVDAARNIAAPLLALGSVGGLFAGVTARADHILKLDQFASKINSTVQDVDAFQRAIVLAGGEGEAALDALATLSERVGESFSDKEGSYAKDFASWGVKLKNSKGEALGASDAMVELAGNLERVSKAEALGRLSMIGITDAATIEFLLRGKKAVREVLDEQKRLGVVTDDQVKRVRDYQKAMGSLRGEMARMSDTVTDLVLPYIVQGAMAIGRAFDWMGKNRKLVEGFFIGISAAVTAYYLPAMARAAAATIVATWPFIAIGAAIAAVGAAFALAYEDVNAFLNGQPSLIGELAARYEWFAEVVKGIGEVFKWLSGEWDRFLVDLQAVAASLIAEFEAIKQDATRIGAALSELFSPLVEAIKNIFSAVSELVTAISGIGGAASDAKGEAEPALDLIKTAVEAIGPAVKLLADIFRTVLGGAVSFVSGLVNGLAEGVRYVTGAISGMGSPAVIAPQTTDARGQAWSGGVPVGGGQQALRAGQGALGAAGGAPQGLGAAGTKQVNSTSSVSIGNVNVNTQATDAQGIARAVRGELSNQLRDTSSQFDTGVDR